MPVRVNDKRRSERDTAAEILRLFWEQMRTHSNLAAIVLWLAREKRSVQRRVLDALRGPRKRGAPRNAISDEEWLTGVDAWRKEMQQRDGLNHCPASDLTVIRDWLANTNTRYKRDEGTRFQPDRAAGNAEICRVRDAVVRARRRRKNPSKMP